MPDATVRGQEPTLSYIAFRIAEAGDLLPVVAALEPGEDNARFPWAKWYHELAPDGEFKKVPGDYASLRIDESVAKTMIDMIKAGGALPPEFVSELRIVH